MTEQAIALDASVRTIDANGHLRVGKTVISKAAVNPYYGREIPGHEGLGLDPGKIYQLLRDPDELKSAADTFKGKQLLIKHIPVDSKDPKKEFTIGAIGSDISFENNNLYADLTVWDDVGIGLIESKKMQELSAGYSYMPDMTPGEFNGAVYDGVMRSIHGNHVTIVERGRIGRDAVIADSLPFEMGLNMKLKKGAMQRITAKLGMDEDKVKELVEEVAENIEHKPAYDEAKLRELAGDNYEEIVKLIGGEVGGEDEAPEKPEDGADKPAADEDDGPKATEERKKLEETDKDDREAKAMDADTIAATVEARINAKYAARDAVEPIVGRIAMDGFSDAKAIYEYALKQKGIACDGINEAGLKALVAMQRDSKPAATVAMDHAPVSDLTKRFKQG